MRIPSFFRSIRARLAALIIIAMTALVVLLVYQQIEQRQEEQQHGDENLQRLATFAAHAQRERFDTAHRLLVIAQQAASLRTVALTPDSTEAYDACTRSLFVLDQLLPETSGFSLWDTQGSVLCSSEAAKRGEFNASERAWFQTAVSRQDFSTGDFELSPPNDEPSIGFGIPIRDAEQTRTIAYLSTGLRLRETDRLFTASSLPESARITLVDRNGVIIGSSNGRNGDVLPGFTESPAFTSLNSFLDSALSDAPGDRRRAAVRVTDSDDAPVTVVVGADKDVLAEPLTEALLDGLLPIAVVTLLSLAAVWMLGQRWVVGPVGSLVSASEALARGDLSARARVSRGTSEFEKLALSFNEMAASRERVNDAKDEFLGLVSHELRTPITTVLGNAAILRTRGDQLTPDLRQGALDDIHESAQRLVAIIDNLLALARLERGAGLESEPLALVRLARVAAEDELARAPRRQVLVHGDASLLALGGQTHVEQVLRNLIGNALKYSPPDDPVDVIIDRDRDMATVRVCDRGDGVPDDERDAVFQPFYRSARTAGSAEGVGIGLSVCKRLVEAQGGSIWCAPRPGGGTEFGFSLLAIDAGEAVTDAAGEAEGDRLRVATA